MIGILLRYVLPGLALVGAIWWGYSSIKAKGYEEARVEYQQKIDNREAEIAAAVKAAEQAARDTEAEHRKALADIDAKHEQERRDAQVKADAVVAGLRDGTVRLRRQWEGCRAAAPVPGTAPDSGIADAGTDDRDESAGRVVRAAAECDAQVRGLQAVIRMAQGQTR